MPRKLLLPLLFFIYSYTIFSQLFQTEKDERVRNYDVQNISIEVKLDLKNKHLDGRVTTLIKSRVPMLSSFKVDAVGMNIRSVKGWIHSASDDPEQALDFKDIKYDYDNSVITVYPFAPVRENFPFMYEVEYSVTNPEKGIYFIGPSEKFPDKPYQVWTQGQAEDNRYWFPCYDYPNDMAATEVIITIDSIFETVSNGRLVDKRINPDGTITWQWVQEKPHVSYLVMLAAGNWDKIEESWDGIPVISYVPKGRLEWGKRSYRHTTDIINFFSQHTGYRYPWDNFFQIVVEDFIYGGMENTGAVVLFSGSVYDEFTEPDYSATGLVAHELAHQWWGDLLTCRNWNEIWLNEGFATYYQCLYFEHLYGKDEFDYNIYRNSESAIWTDLNIYRKPVHTHNGHVANIYSKGSVVLNMLRYLIGDENFRKAMNLYILENLHKPVSTRDLINAINKTMDGQSRIKTLSAMPSDISWFFDEWIYNAGQPDYLVSYDYNKENKELALTVQQIHRTDSSSVFKTPVPVKIITDSGTEELYLSSSLSPQTYRIRLNSPPRCVIFNSGNKILCRLFFEKQLNDWLYQLKYSSDAIDRITAVKGLEQFIENEKVLNELINAAKNDPFWGVRYEAAQIIGNSRKLKIDEQFLNNYKNETDPRVRRAYLTSLGNVIERSGAPDNSPNIELFLKQIITNTTSYYESADAIRTLSKLLPPEQIYGTLTTYLDKESHNDVILRSVLESLKKSDDPSCLEIFLHYAEYGKSARVRNEAIRGMEKYINDNRVAEFLSKIIFENTRSTQRTILELISNSRNPIFKPVLNELLYRTNDPHFKEKIREVMGLLQ